MCCTGYGMQTAAVTKQLADAGHDVAIFCFFGLQGSKVDWGNVTLLPSWKEGYGEDVVDVWYDYWKPDVLISLVDIWVLKDIKRYTEKYQTSMRWVPWVPVDHDPIPPRVLDVVKNHVSIVKPIAMSKHGVGEMWRNEIDCYHIPHEIDCQTFKPDTAAREKARKAAGWEDKFVVGTVATNSIRKNWNASMIAMQEFTRRHDDVIWYCHTNVFDQMGFDHTKARVAYGLEEFTAYPEQTLLRTGIPQEVLAAAYNALDVFLLPSKGEGFGIPAVEAQACGVPVILADNTAQTEMCGSGWLLPRGNPVWDLQDSFEYDTDPADIIEALEKAYRMKKDGSIVVKQREARAFAMQFEEGRIFTERWIPVLEDIEIRVKDLNAKEEALANEAAAVDTGASPVEGEEEREPAGVE